MYTIIFKTSIKLALYSGEQINSIDLLEVLTGPTNLPIVYLNNLKIWIFIFKLLIFDKVLKWPKDFWFIPLHRNDGVTGFAIPRKTLKYSLETLKCKVYSRIRKQTKNYRIGNTNINSSFWVANVFKRNLTFKRIYILLLYFIT